jgi:hypothetical protein
MSKAAHDSWKRRDSRFEYFNKATHNYGLWQSVNYEINTRNFMIVMSEKMLKTYYKSTSRYMYMYVGGNNILSHVKISFGL